MFNVKVKIERREFYPADHTGLHQPILYYWIRYFGQAILACIPSGAGRPFRGNLPHRSICALFGMKPVQSFEAALEAPCGPALYLPWQPHPDRDQRISLIGTH
jgi:hypothetical protein